MYYVGIFWGYSKLKSKNEKVKRDAEGFKNHPKRNVSDPFSLMPDLIEGSWLPKALTVQMCDPTQCCEGTAQECCHKML
jgi:hypothetical protein